MSNKLLSHALESIKGVVSFQVIQEFANVSLQKFAKPLKSEDFNDGQSIRGLKISNPFRQFVKSRTALNRSTLPGFPVDS